MVLCEVCLEHLDGRKGPAYPILEGKWVHTKNCGRYIDRDDIQKVFKTQTTLDGRHLNYEEFMAVVRRARQEVMDRAEKRKSRREEPSSPVGIGLC
jgi:hypothetical protein